MDRETGSSPRLRSDVAGVGAWTRPAGSGADAPLVVSLARATAAQLPLIGGKAANLARMLRAGFAVPPGFCLTTEAFGRFVAACPRHAQMSAALTQPAGDRLDEVASLSQRVVAGLAGIRIPAAVEAALLEAWRAHGTGRAYAVRSSATLEDAAAHSFAGQFESRLNVRGPDALREAVKACWLSLFSARALAYLMRSGLPIEHAAMAVIVQEMVPADVAGVLFTEHPAWGAAGCMVIEATAGLGDQLVGGKVKPERVVLAKKTLRVVEHSALDGAGLLDEKSARRLGKLARKVERFLGGPQDIEWAWAGGRVFLLQARPVTAIRPAKSWEDRQIWSNINAGEVAPDVMTPVTWSLIQLFIAELARPLFRLLGAEGDRAPSIGLIAGRIYFNVHTGLAAVRPFAGLLWGIPNATKALGGAPIPGHEDGLPDACVEDLPDLGFRWPKYVLSWPRVLGDLIAHSPRRGDAWTAGLKIRGDAGAGLDLASLSALELARCFDRLLREGFKGWDLLYLVTQGCALPWFQWACQKWLDDPDLTLGYRLFSALGGLPETEAGLALWRLAALAHADPAAEAAVLAGDGWATVRAKLEVTDPGRPFLEAWAAFMAEHGHHGRGELELANPRWVERPDYVLGIVRGYLRTIEQVNPLENQRRLAQERERLTAECLQRLRNPIKRWILSRSLRRAQKLAFNREEWKNQAVRHLALLRRVLLALGERLGSAGVLARADDVFFLEVTEMESVASGQAPSDIRAVVAQRRADYDRNLTLHPPPIVMGRFDPDTPAVPTVEPTAKTLKGIPVFPGVVTGPARVILRADDHEQVLPGEILVAPFTDPAWTPYFLPAAGVVMDLGGILSHGSIVAREYGLPAVTNLGCATQLIRTGDVVRVDGGRGQVTILERAAPP